MLRAPLGAPKAEDGLGRALEFTRGHSAVHYEIFGEAMRVMVRLGGELANVDTRLKTEDHLLVHEWH